MTLQETHTIRIGTRGSQLAMWQANFVAAQLRAQGHSVEIEVIRTVGDRMQDPAFAQQASEQGLAPNGVGVFIREIEEALAAGRIDVAVHSLKDLPTLIDARFAIAAVPKRADARDAFVCEECWGLHTLPMGARVATTSPRRQAMVLALRPDVVFVPMRGNIDTRLRKWEAGEADALILAAAGLDRLGRTEHVHYRFSIDEICPAPGQGALALEVRAAQQESASARDKAIYYAVRALNDAPSEYAVNAERAVLAGLGSGCQLALGAHCQQVDDQWQMHAMVVAADGERVIHLVHSTSVMTPAAMFGATVAEALIARGARELLAGEDVAAD